MIDIDWTAAIIEDIEANDISPNKLATRVAKRILEKGFTLLHAVKENGRNEGFSWGRSSIGRTRIVIYKIGFEHDGKEHVVNVVVSITTYEKKNPYDKIPANNGRPSANLMATDDTKIVLGWKLGGE